MVGCRSSGVVTASKVWDGVAASGKEIARISLAPEATIEFDMHGVLCSAGLYIEEVSGAMAASVEYA